MSIISCMVLRGKYTYNICNIDVLIIDKKCYRGRTLKFYKTQIEFIYRKREIFILSFNIIVNGQI